MRRLILLFSALLAVNGFADTNLNARRYFKNNGGLFDHISPILTPEDSATSIVNFTMDDRGQLTARAGYRLNSSTNTLASTTTAITGGGYHNATSGSSFFGVIVGTNAYRTTNSFGGTYSVITGTVSITSSASNLAQHTSLNDALIFCNESDPPFKITSTGNAFKLVGVATGTKTCATYGNYLVTGNISEGGTSYPSRVRWSDIKNPDSWPALNYIDVEADDGDQIIDVISFEDALYIFKKRSIYIMLLTGLDGPDAFIIRPFSRNIGCWAKNSARVIPNVGIAFLAQNTAYLLTKEGLDPIGDPIQRSFDAVQRSKWSSAVAAVYPKRYQYLINVSTGGAANNETLVYDYIQKAWTTYSGSFNMMEQAEDSTGRNLLVAGDYTGNIYLQDIGDTADNFLNVASPIDTIYTTGWLTQDAPERNKNYKYIYVFTQVTSTASLTVSAAFDYGTNFEYTQSVGLGISSALYDTAVYDVDTYVLSGYQVSRFEINRSARAIKLKFISSSTAASINVVGWTLLHSIEDWK